MHALLLTFTLLSATTAQTDPAGAGEDASQGAPEQTPDASEPTPPEPEQKPAPDPAPKPRARTEQPGTSGLSVPLEPPTSPRPHMQWDEPVLCAELGQTQKVPSGHWRAQCDDDRRVCLLVPAFELDADGMETERRLTRVRACSATGMDLQARATRGWRFLPAIAEAPPGWIRDERGRVMQFSFDLHRRIYVGGAWSPLWVRGEPSPDTGRYRADFGIEIEIPDRDDDTLFRLGLLEGEFFLGDNSASLTAFRYDWSRAHSRPLARVTTFVGAPRRFDIVLNVGGYLETLTFESFRREGLTENRLLLGTAQPTFDLWHSKDLVSFVRVRAGPAGVLDTRRRTLHLAAEAALEGDVTLDEDGFHHLRLSVEADKLFFTGAVNDASGQRVANPQRLGLRGEYEVILLAINDQPLSLLVDGRGGWRDDVANRAPRWEWSASAGLRFSLWAPARRAVPELGAEPQVIRQ